MATGVAACSRIDDFAADVVKEVVKVSGTERTISNVSESVS